MTSLDQLKRIRETWRKRAAEVSQRLTDLENERIAYKDLLRTIEVEASRADAAVAAAEAVPPKRRTG